MTQFPVELIIADGVSMFFLTLGSIFLIRFFLKFGSKKSKYFSIPLCIFIIFYAVFHEGLEILWGGYGIGYGKTVFTITLVISTSYFVTSLLLKKEMVWLTTPRSKNVK